LGLSAAAPVIAISTASGQGLDLLSETLYGVAIGESDAATRPALVTSRQFDALRRAAAAINAALAARSEGVPLDLLAVDVRTALYAVGEITGEHVSEAVLDEIFSRFCIGK
jgi:tRNA modification GTPase